MSRLSAFVAFFFAMIVLTSALSVEVKIKASGAKRLTCKGFITFLALDTNCGECLYGVRDLRYATVECKTPAGAVECCKTIADKW